MKKTAGKFVLFVFASFLLSPEVSAHHGAKGWYANGTSLVGPAADATAACLAGSGLFHAMQHAQVDENNWPQQDKITSFSHVAGSVCHWNTAGGGSGGFGEVFFHESGYYPPLAYSPQMNGGCCEDLEGNPINPATGNKFQVERDYAGVAPSALTFVRYYNSFAADGRRAGFSEGWTHTYSARLIRDDGNIISIRPDGKALRFTLVSGSYVADATAAAQLERVTTPSLGWKLTTTNDEVETYDDPGALLSITDRAGLTQTLAYTAGQLSSVTDPYGRTLTIARDSYERIQSIVTPLGTISYTYGSDVRANLLTVTYPGPATRTYHYEFSAVSKLTGITDENGERFSTYTYDSSGRANGSEHAGGANKVTLVHDSSTGARNTLVARHVSATLSAQRTYAFESIGAIGRKTGITANSGEPCPGCGPAVQTNDANANPSSKTDWNGNRTNYMFDTARNLETSRTEGLTSGGATTPQTRTITTQWHSTFRLRTGIAEPLRITTFAYDADGTTCGSRGAICSISIQATSDTNGSQDFSATPVGSPRTWTYTYNANGSVLTVNEPRTDLTDLTTYTYYANNASCPTSNGGHATGCRGQVETVTNALSQVTSVLAYDALGQSKHIVDPNGLVVTLTYNARGKPLTHSVGGETTTYEYDLAEQLTKVMLPDGSFLSSTYDNAHRLTAIQDNLGNKIAYTLDAMGNRTLEEVRDPSNALAQARSRVYSNLNRLFQEIGASSQTTEYTYDDQGNVLTVKDPLNRTTTNQYDALNRLKQVTSPTPISAVTQYGYDGIDQLVSVTDPRSLVTGYTVNGLGNLTQLSSPDTGTATSTYDAAGNLLTQTDAESQVTTYTYDALNRVTSITFQDGSKQNYFYDSGSNGIGSLTGITELNPSLVTIVQAAYGYDQKGRVVSEARTVNSVTYTTAYRYDAFGRIDRITYPSGRTVEYGFDPGGRISGVTTTPSGGSAQTIASSVTYHPFGGVKTFNFGNGQTYARSYDQDGRTATYTLAGTGYTLGYDAASRIEFITETANPPNTNTYGYDNLDRLTSATLPATVYGYTYDGVGNRLTRSTGGNTDTYAYGSTSNRIASITPSSGPVRNFTLDNVGSATADGNNTYTYDTRGRMVQAVSSLGTTTYQVNALGQRIRKTNTLGDTVYHYDTGGRLIAETTAAGALKREYLYLRDIPLAVVVQP